MRYLAVLIIGLSLVAGSQTALAGGHGYRGHGGGHGGHYYRPYYGSHHGHHSNDAAYLIGGLALGALFTSAYYRSPRYVETGYSYPQGVVASYPRQRLVYRTVTPAPTVITGRRLLRDLEGRCWEKQIDDQGNELRIELPAEQCDW